jgi:hypothetical protein
MGEEGNGYEEMDREKIGGGKRIKQKKGVGKMNIEDRVDPPCDIISKAHYTQSHFLKLLLFGCTGIVLQDRFRFFLRPLFLNLIRLIQHFV